MSRRIRISGDLEWRVERDPDDDSFVGVCDRLNLVAVGDTWQEFEECALEAVQLLLQDLHEDGELDAFLLERGLAVETDFPEPGEPVEFDVPVNVILERNQQSALAYA